MSTSGITSSLLSQVLSSSSAANQFATDLNQLAKDLKSGNLAAAQQDFVTLSDDAQTGAGSSTSTTSTSGVTTALLSDVASSSTGSGTFINDLNQLGNDLASGDLSSAQNDMLAVETAAESAAPASSTSSSSTTNSADLAALIKATVEAMEFGNSSTISADMSELASSSTNSAGASYLESASQSYSAGTASSSSLGSLGQLLQGLNSNGSSNSSGLSLLV